jgi:glycosyltransferase involved in cell wall biosynthesis
MRKRGIGAERVHVLPAGLPEPEAPAEAEVEAFRDRFGLRERRVLTIFGFVTPDKGYETALDALAALPPAVKLLIAGGTRVEHEAGYLDQLRETIRTRGLQERVAITGYLEDRQDSAAMALSEVVLVPHLAANGSYSVMIALAHGRPVLASDLACFREIAEEARCLELFDVGDERMLAERAGFLLASAGTRKKLAAAATDYARQRNWGAVAEKTLAIYEGVKRQT